MKAEGAVHGAVRLRGAAQVDGRCSLHQVPDSSRSMVRLRVAVVRSLPVHARTVDMEAGEVHRRRCWRMRHDQCGHC